jgi:GT2 family glycosyltransferase
MEMQTGNNAQGISVVIPNYNGAGLLAKNLPSVYAALQASGCPYQVIVADDASTDDSVTFLKQHYPDIIIIISQKNSGFSVNINKGIAATTLPLVLLLNSDIELSDNYFLNQLKYFELPDTFGVMGQIRDEATGEIAEACKYPKPSLFKINHIKNVAIAGPHVYTFYLSGANALVNRQKLLSIGGFNEIYTPFYHEDIDLSLRAWESGWKCYYNDSAVCRHAVSTTIKSHSSKTRVKIISTRNRLLLHAFHLQGIRLYMWHLLTFLELWVKWLTGRLYYYKAYALFLKKLPTLLAYKAQFISNAVTDRQFIPYNTVKGNIKTALDKYIK